MYKVTLSSQQAASANPVVVEVEGSRHMIDDAETLTILQDDEEGEEMEVAAFRDWAHFVTTK